MENKEKKDTTKKKKTIIERTINYKLLFLLIIIIFTHIPVIKYCKGEILKGNIKKLNVKNGEHSFFRQKRDINDVENNNVINNKIDDTFNQNFKGFRNYKTPIGPEEYSETRYVPTNEKLKVYREKVSEMFHYSYDNYIQHAYPEDELKPISCTGQNTWGNFSLTLIDALDTFAVMNDIEGFENALEKVKKINFDMDINISVFETTIRILGGLLSSHLIAKDLGNRITYHDELLVLAEDLGQRLLPAFDTPTGMPFGSVNLKHGVQPEETTVTCTATIGTCSIEFSWLSILTNNPIYEFTCRRAIHSLWSHRTNAGLIGAHIDVFTGFWTEAVSIFFFFFFL
uniref:alpha-1,2-Mannosidase n=1 Tax=Feramyces austinii TaxID=2170546 RepID=A0A2S1TZC6_9FUNG|nr:Glycosyl hydrolase family 47 [Feramyces austinii]